MDAVAPAFARIAPLAVSPFTNTPFAVIWSVEIFPNTTLLFSVVVYPTVNASLILTPPTTDTVPPKVNPPLALIPLVNRIRFENVCPLVTVGCKKADQIPAVVYVAPIEAAFGSRFASYTFNLFSL